MPMADMQSREMSRRQLLSVIGKAAGGAAAYQAMVSLGHAAPSDFRRLSLDGDPKGASVLILGAGLAGLIGAYELAKAGYKVEVLEYAERVGGRSWTLRGGDTYTELGGFRQVCEFEKGLYLNPGPWRIPYHHRGMLDYCRRFGVALEPFLEVNHNAYVHSPKAFGGKPQRFREVLSDYQGGIAELLAKAVRQEKLDDLVSKEDKELLLESLRSFGALNRSYAYKAGERASERRGYDKDPGGGLDGEWTASQPVALNDVLRSGLWRQISLGNVYEYQPTLFQPVGGMDMLAKALGREVSQLIRFNAKVTAICQDEKGVTASYTDAQQGGETRSVRADWCLCTIPLSVLSQIEMNVGAPMRNAIGAVPYLGSTKIGLEFKRRFWEEDEAIYGGISFTDLPIQQIAYPSTGYGTQGKAVLLGAYMFGAYAYEFTALPPAERIAKALAWGAEIHPQYGAEFETGMAVSWSRAPGALGCFGYWDDKAREQHYRNLCAIDGRVALAGEHASYLPAWQEGAVLSALDAISRLHQRVVNG
jgi:monoamine oxidase